MLEASRTGKACFESGRLRFYIKGFGADRMLHTSRLPVTLTLFVWEQLKMLGPTTGGEFSLEGNMGFKG